MKPYFAVFFLVLVSGAHAADKPVLPESAVLKVSKALAEQILTIQESGIITEEIVTPKAYATSEHVEILNVHGVPSTVKAFTPGQRVFRHYFDKQQRDEILLSGRLKSAANPYVQYSKGLHKKKFVDLTGVFFTLKSRKPFEVGVPADSQYVDVIIPEGFPFFEIEKNRIYLLPLPATYYDWVTDLVERFRKGEEIPSVHQKMIEQVVRLEGARDLTQVYGAPVNIVGINPKIKCVEELESPLLNVSKKRK